MFGSHSLVLLSLADTPFEIINDNASSLRKRRVLDKSLNTWRFKRWICTRTAWNLNGGFIISNGYSLSKSKEKLKDYFTYKIN